MTSSSDIIRNHKGWRPGFQFRVLDLFLCLLAGMLAGCGGKTEAGSGGEGRPIVTVSFPGQKWLLERIAGDRVSVNTLLSSSSDPEHYDPSVSDLRNLEGSVLWLTFDTPGFESTLRRNVEANLKDVKVVNVAEGIVTDFGTHPGGDPHILGSVRNARMVAREMTDALVSVDNANADEYRGSFRRLDSILKVLDDSVAAVVERGKKSGVFMVYHPSLSYFARDYGLCQLAVENDGKEVSAREYRRRVDEAVRVRPDVIYFDRSHGFAKEKEMSEMTGVPLQGVSFNGEDWLTTIREIADGFGKQGNK